MANLKRYQEIQARMINEQERTLLEEARRLERAALREGLCYHQDSNGTWQLYCLSLLEWCLYARAADEGAEQEIEQLFASIEARARLEHRMIHPADVLY